MSTEKIIKAANKICGQGECFAGYDCGHSNKLSHCVPLLGKHAECPLAKYGIAPDENPEEWCKKPFEETAVFEEDIFVLCEDCAYSHTSNDGKYRYIHRDDLEGACIDCPVKSAEENIQECDAEAAIS